MFGVCLRAENEIFLQYSSMGIEAVFVGNDLISVWGTKSTSLLHRINTDSVFEWVVEIDLVFVSGH